jgi:gluconate 2-dehydrogenase gamma chain
VVQFEISKGFVIPKRGLSARRSAVALAGSKQIPRRSGMTRGGIVLSPTAPLPANDTSSRKRGDIILLRFHRPRPPVDQDSSSRRQFVIRSLSGIGSAWLTLHWPAILAARDHAHATAQADAQVALQFFSSEQAIEIEAATAQIIPSDETPGAREAKVVYFIDRALVTFERDKQPAYTQGLKDLENKTKSLFPQVDKFSSLSQAQQVKLLEAIEQTEFFELLRMHTIIGFLARPEYGGNQGGVGWKLIGFENKGVYSPPFGYYDAEIAKGK